MIGTAIAVVVGWIALGGVGVYSLWRCSEITATKRQQRRQRIRDIVMLRLIQENKL